MRGMNRYETTLTLTVSLKAENEVEARKLLSQVERQLQKLSPITYLQGGDDFDCMEAA